jgi:hypothetical protein
MFRIEISDFERERAVEAISVVPLSGMSITIDLASRREGRAAVAAARVVEQPPYLFFWQIGVDSMPWQI